MLAAGVSLTPCFMTGGSSASPLPIDWDSPEMREGVGGDWGSALLAAAGLILILAALFFITRYFGGKGYTAKGDSRMRVIQRLALGRDSYVAIVEIAGRFFALGVSRDHINVLTELDASLFDGAGKGLQATGNQDGKRFINTFTGVFKSAFGVSSNKGQKSVNDDTEPDGKQESKADFRVFLDENKARLAEETESAETQNPIPSSELAPGSGRLSFSSKNALNEVKKPFSDYNAALEAIKRYGENRTSGPGTNPNVGSVLPDVRAFMNERRLPGAQPAPAVNNNHEMGRQEKPASAQGHNGAAAERSAAEEKAPDLMDDIMYSVEKRKRRYNGKTVGTSDKN